MDVTLPIGVATVAGTPPAGGVPDVLARPAGADGTLPPDAFAALLATLGLGGVDATDGERAADDGVDTSPDGSPEAASGALVVEALGLLPQPTVPPIVPTAAAGSGDATAVLPPTPEDPVAAGSLPQPNTEAPGGTVASPAGAVPAAELSAPAETAVHAVSSDQARRTGASDIAAATPSPTKGPAPAAAEHSLAAVAEAAADSPVSIHRDAREEPPVGAHVPSQRPQDAARIERVAEAPEQPKPALPADAAAPTIDEATALLRRREPVPAQPDPASGVRHATGAEPMTNAPRPTTGSLPAPPSDASTAYRYAEAAMLPETSRPVGRLRGRQCDQDTVSPARRAVSAPRLGPPREGGAQVPVPRENSSGPGRGTPLA